jgi:hypothetical protein
MAPQLTAHLLASGTTLRRLTAWGEGFVPTVAEVLILLAAVGGSGAMVGFLGWLLYRVKRLEGRGTADNADVERIMEQVDGLREQLSNVREEIGELHERVDFTERLLTRGQARDTANRDDPRRR